MSDVLSPFASPDVALADASRSLRHVFVRDLELDARVGVYDHEKKVSQRVRINLDLAVHEDVNPADDLGNVVCYEAIANGVRGIVHDGHVNLVETLAERIAEFCLEDPRVQTARVRVEKLHAIPDATSVGIEIERMRL